MPSFSIYFFGLICHIGKSRKVKRRAAIVRDDGHFPIIMFGRNDWLPLESVKRVRLQRLPHVKTETDPLFREYVPSVKTILGGTLPANVDDGSAEDLAIFLSYPTGTLSVFDLYAKGARYLVDDEEAEELWSGRVARITGLSTPAPEATVTVRLEGIEFGDGNEVTIEREVASDSCILFANISTDIFLKFPEFLTVNVGLQNLAPSTQPPRHEHGHHGAKGAAEHPHEATTTNHNPHIQHYGRILDNEMSIRYEEIDVEPETVSPPQCTWVRNFIHEMADAEILSSVNPECGNTDWP